MGRNSKIWRFVRDGDGTFSVYHEGKLLKDRIPEEWFTTQICESFGFCGKEADIIFTAVRDLGELELGL